MRGAAITLAVVVAAGCSSSTGEGGGTTPPGSTTSVVTSVDASASSGATSATGTTSISSSGSTTGTTSTGITSSDITSSAPSGSSGATASTSASGTSSGSSSAGSDPLDELPPGPLTDQIRWYVGVLRSGTAPTVTELQRRFAPSLFAELSPDQLRTAVQQVIALKPQQLTAFSGDTRQGVAVLALAGGRRLLVTLSVDDSGQLDALLNQPAPALPTITSPGDLVEAATTVGARSSLLVADDDCRPLTAPGASVDADEAVPLGSMFKLYVLGAVTDAVADGRLAWTDTLTIDAAVRSFPSGELQDSPANTEVSVQQAATLMISISDNTATDALIRAVGARAVEAAVRAMGSSHPSLLSPFPTTKQIFTLATDAPLRKQWAATFERAADGTTAESTPAQVTARRTLIEQIPDALPSQAAFAAAPAGWLDGVEWFASATDICRAQVALHEMAGTPAGAPLRAILTKNPGVGELGVPTTSVAFKGGSNIGVLTGSWLVERTDGDLRVLVWTMRGDTAAQVPDTQYFAVSARSALRLLAR